MPNYSDHFPERVEQYENTAVLQEITGLYSLARGSVAALLRLLVREAMAPSRIRFRVNNLQTREDKFVNNLGLVL